MYGDRRNMKGLSYCPFCKTYHSKHLVCPQKRIALDSTPVEVVEAELEAAEAANPVEEVVEDVVEETVVEEPVVEDEPVEEVTEEPVEETPVVEEPVVEDKPAPKKRTKKAAEAE